MVIGIRERIGVGRIACIAGTTATIRGKIARSGNELNHCWEWKISN